MNRIRQALYNFLMSTYSLWGKTKAWRNAWERIIQPKFDLSTRLHGLRALIPSTYRYPLTARQVSTFNNPYVELIFQVWKEKGRQLVIADVGAAVGDGLFLVEQNIGQAINTIYCLDGHKDFLFYLQKNAKQFENAHVIGCILSDREESIPSLVEIHSTTASARGDQLVHATTLEKLWGANNLQTPDVIKIDVDGFDLKVIAGAVNLLKSCHAYLLFEYHPWHLLDTGGDPQIIFPILNELGYQRLIWFDKFGVYKTETMSDDAEGISSLREAAFNAGREPDVHYDLIALPPYSQLNIDELKNCNFARKKPFPF
jgi:FkbM family methyltransferase